MFSTEIEIKFLIAKNKIEIVDNFVEQIKF